MTWDQIKLLIDYVGEIKAKVEQVEWLQSMDAVPTIKMGETQSESQQSIRVKLHNVLENHLRAFVSADAATIERELREDVEELAKPFEYVMCFLEEKQ